MQLVQNKHSLHGEGFTASLGVHPDEKVADRGTTARPLPGHATTSAESAD